MQIELEAEHQSAPAWVIVLVTVTLVALTTAAVVYGVRWLLHKQRDVAYVAIQDDIELPVSHGDHEQLRAKHAPVSTDNVKNN